jgi:peptide methionine sulfoxide reductase msrA/msrB
MMMKRLILAVIFIPLISCSQNDMNTKKLTPEEEYVIVNKGTERPWSGKYVDSKEEGVYTCKRCGAELYRSTDKFDSHCGWPSFDDAIPGAVKRIPDADGIRTEIICAKCGAHLGHVFEGEGFTPKDTRHCVNSVSLDFIPAGQAAVEQPKLDTAIFAGGCFWGVEYYMQKKDGVKTVVSGYIGGHTDHPTYQQVCTGTTGHAEAVEISFDPAVVSYEEVAKLFFEIHDPTQVDRQGPDVGLQYRSEVFYRNEEQKKTAENLIDILKSKGYKVATKVTKATTFWPAEDYHQDYYEHKGTLPYCHGYVQRF